VFTTSTVHLDGSGSTDVDGDFLTYVWSFTTVPAGSNATIDDPSAVTPTFVVQLSVSDGSLASVDTVVISTVNSAPVADAGPDQTVLVEQQVTLDGTGSSDVDGDSLTYLWSFTSRPSGSSAILSSPTAAG